MDQARLLLDQDGAPYSPPYAPNKGLAYLLNGTPDVFVERPQRVTTQGGGELDFVGLLLASELGLYKVNPDRTIGGYLDLGREMVYVGGQTRLTSVKLTDGTRHDATGIDYSKVFLLDVFPFKGQTCAYGISFANPSGLYCGDPWRLEMSLVGPTKSGSEGYGTKAFVLRDKLIIGAFFGPYIYDGTTTAVQPKGGLPQNAFVTDVCKTDNKWWSLTSQGVYSLPAANLSASSMWQQVNVGAPAGAQMTAIGCYGMGVTVATVENGRAQFYKSDTEGGGFTREVDGLDSGYLYSLCMKPDGTVYAGSNNGVWRYMTDTWVNGSVGIDNARVTSVFVPSSSSSRRALAGEPTVFVTTGGNDNGVYRSTNGGRGFTPADSSMKFVVGSALAEVGSVLVAGTSTGVARSTDGGASFTFPPANVALTSVSTLAVSGNNLLAGTPHGVLRSTDTGLSWLSTSLTGAGAQTPRVILSAPNAVYVGESNALYKSTDGGATYGKTTAPPTTGSFTVTSLAASGSTVYAGFTDFALVNGVSASSDGGASWRSISNGLPVAAVNALLSAGGELFAGTNVGLFRSADGGASWSVYEKHLVNTTILALAASSDTLYVGTATHSTWALPLQPSETRLVSIVLDVPTAQAHFTTELTLSNRGTKDASVSALYTASIGTSEGSGTVHDTLRAGQQLVIPDVIAYLRQKGLAIPAGGAQGGTLLLTFDGLSGIDVIGVTARTATATAAPQPVGRAGLAYSGIDPREGVPFRLTVYGLRQNATDRSNLAVFNTSAVPVTLKVTAYSGLGEGAPKVIEASRTLPPWGWYQYNGILATAGFTSGWVTVENAAAGGAGGGGGGSFSAYGVVNDQGTSDGSYLLPNNVAHILSYINVPVVVEVGAFLSELVVANSGTTDADLSLAYTESLSAGAGGGGTVHLTLHAGEQRIIPGIVDFLRSHGAAIGPKGGSYAGSLHIVASGALTKDLYAAARTASQSAAGGQFGLFTPGAYAGDEANDVAYLYGLRSDDTNRSNVAVENTGEAGAGTVTLSIQAYDGDAGGAAAGGAEVIELQPGQWHQYNDFLRSKGVRNGWVAVTRTAGTANWHLYAIVNDGAGPGQRTGDGAFVPATR